MTSQIFANIYLHELDWHAKHFFRPLAYLRYGDDFLVFSNTQLATQDVRARTMRFLSIGLRLNINASNDFIFPVRRGIHWLGVRVFPHGRRISRRNRYRIERRLCLRNAASYSGLLQHHGNTKDRKLLTWQLLSRLEILESL